MNSLQFHFMAKEMQATTVFKTLTFLDNRRKSTAETISFASQIFSEECQMNVKQPKTTRWAIWTDVYSFTGVAAGFTFYR